MRHIANKLLAVLIAAFIVVSVVHASAAAGSVTVSPAALKLKLGKGQQQTSTEFSITNHYQTAVSLQFGVDKSQQDASGQSTPGNQLSISPSEVTILPGETAKQILSLQDSTDWPPGSRLADVVIHQKSAQGQGVGVLPAVRLPVTIIKYDGAISSLGLANVGGPGLAFGIPSAVTPELRNTGNMITIPRGTITVTRPNGIVVGKGTLNEQSAAIAPGGQLKLKTPITKLAAPVLPGMYWVNVSYGIGEGQPAQTASARFFYMAWWHAAVLLLAAGLAWFTVHNFKTIRACLKRKPQAKQQAPPKSPVLIGRDIT